MKKSTELLQIRNLTVGFWVNREYTEILHQINLDIKENEIVAVIGETGCGKSVTGSAILKTLPRNAEMNGEILYKGNNILDMKEKEFRRLLGKEIASVPQNPASSLDPFMKIGKQIGECLHYKKDKEKSDKKQIKEAIFQILNKMNFSKEKKIYHSYPCELSGGMKQRILLAMGMISSPRLLIVDEPTKAIDWIFRKEIILQMKAMKEELKCSMLFITHDLKAANLIADRVIVMYQGDIVESGKTTKIMNHAEHSYTQRLLASMPVKIQHT